jgi:hypothetical protein
LALSPFGIAPVWIAYARACTARQKWVLYAIVIGTLRHRGCIAAARWQYDGG